MASIVEIENFLSWLTDNQAYNEAEEQYFWPKLGNKWHCSCCTHSALIIAERFKGQVYGYAIPAKLQKLVGASSFGHDFAVIGGEYIVDWWATIYEQSPYIVEIEHGIAKGLYKEIKEWVLVADYREDKTQKRFKRYSI